MAAIIQHVPGFIEAKPETATFTSLEELLAIPWVARWREPWWEEDEPVNFYRFSVRSKARSYDVTSAHDSSVTASNLGWH